MDHTYLEVLAILRQGSEDAAIHSHKVRVELARKFDSLTIKLRDCQLSTKTISSGFIITLQAMLATLDPSSLDSGSSSSSALKDYFKVCLSLNEFLEALLKLLLQSITSAAETKEDGFRLDCDYNLTDESLWKFILIVTGLIQFLLRKSPEEGQSDRFLLAADEALAALCLRNYASIIKCWTVKAQLYSCLAGTNHPVGEAAGDLWRTEYDRKSAAFQTSVCRLKGPYLAQIVQSALQFAKHPSKDLASSALLCLSELLGSCGLLSKKREEEWRGFLPGIFSGLCAVCFLGFKR